MFRIGLKFSCNGLNGVKNHACSRLYLTARYYETRTRVKCEPEGRFCKDVRLTSRLSGHKYSTDSKRSEKSKSSGTLVTLGALAIGTIGVLAFAKSNPEFRATLEGWIPGTDKTIRIIFQEDSNYLELILTRLDALKQKISNITSVFYKGTSEKEETAPKPAFVELVNKKEPPAKEPYAEIRVSKETKEKQEDIQGVTGKPAPPSKDVPKELMPENLVELEKSCGQVAAKAVAAYNTAICALKDYNHDVIKVVESIDSSVPASIWNRLKEATEKRTQALHEAEEHATKVLESLKQMYNLIDDPKLDAPAHVKTAAKRNVKQLLDDLDDVKKKFENELEQGNITERYWKQVRAAREKFSEELYILFPSINLDEKKLSVKEEQFDLFVLHMYNTMIYLQKELEKLQTIHTARVKAALKASKEDFTDAKINELVTLEIEKEKRDLEEKFNKKLLMEQQKFDEELRRELKLHSQIHVDHLKEALSVKEKEMIRAMERALSEQSEEEAMKYKAQQAPIVGRLRGLEAALKARIEEEKGASNAQLLWSACMALARAVKITSQGSSSSEPTIRPLEPEIKAIAKAASKEDPLVRAAIAGIPEEAAKRGVYPEDTLRKKFLDLEKQARRLALVPEEGAALPIHLLSYLQSALIINTSIPKNEIEDGLIDVDSLNTYDILQRARYWLDRGDFKMTLRYMNLLKGAPRSIAREWMNETRILLETQQAIDTLMAYAGVTGLMFIGPAAANSSKQSTGQK
ncbi:PREDICTED: MICOS complex subunit Mic60 isoform X1 [Polistes canadensis]|uniref:MICOS complex subunit Mic60 isoform X1 n=1 Tax=Polistes canadensis TaxID=91411 RepID=UPI000718F6A8|nr:PREDICTED: MICOS complex subunit Mic60 isoform X1 [Polistes canadensis]